MIRVGKIVISVIATTGYNDEILSSTDRRYERFLLNTIPGITGTSVWRPFGNWSGTDNVVVSRTSGKRPIDVDVFFYLLVPWLKIHMDIHMVIRRVWVSSWIFISSWVSRSIIYALVDIHCQLCASMDITHWMISANMDIRVKLSINSWISI